MKKLSLFVMVLVSLPSCAALTRYKCNREYAAKKGMEDAAAGLSSMPSRLDGASCEGDYSGATFSKDYLYGFQQKKQEICSVSAATAYGRTDGESGAANKPQRAKLSLCADVRDGKKIEAAYDREFQKSYCSTGRAAKAGSARAAAWQEADFDSAFSDCPGTGLKKAYMDAYKQSFSAACNPAEAERYGAAEAAARKPVSEGRQRLALCANVGRGNLADVFERAYLSADARLKSEEAARAAAEQERIRQQRLVEFQNQTATVVFPYQLRSYVSRCLVSPDRSYVQVEVENRYPEQVLIQGNWRVQYYNHDFAKITEDRTTEAVLVTGQNRKTFQKMTLPRDAAYCRAEYVGLGG